MPTEKKPPYVAKVSLKMSFPEERYFRGETPLEVEANGQGSNVPVAIARAVRLAFRHPRVKRKSPAYINMSIVVRSRWLVGDVSSPLQ